jgi:hypothetical protein
MIIEDDEEDIDGIEDLKCVMIIETMNSVSQATNIRLLESVMAFVSLITKSGSLYRK